LGGEIEGTLKGGETDIGRLIQEIENETGRKSNEARPRVKRAMAETVRRTIVELEKSEERLK
jgi:hypothetical protein